MVSAQILLFKGHNHFRQRLMLATLTGKPVRIDDIRSTDDQNPGIADYEASFLRLLEKLTNGCSIEISYTGTSVYYRPGVIIGGKIHHDCPVSRSIGYFLEPLIGLAPFAKIPFQITVTGITNDNVDVSVDTIRTVLLPQLKRVGIEGDLQIKISKRGAPPLGGGEVYFTCPTIRALKPLQFTEAGQIKRIRGIAYATRVSPQMANRVMDAARGLLTRYIPDVYIYTDVYKGPESGKSPGYALTLVAESTTDALLSAECAFQPRAGGGPEPSHSSSETVTELAPIDIKTGEPLKKKRGQEALDVNDYPGVASALTNDYNFPTPEDLGIRCARLLLQEIKKGGCVDMVAQWLSILFMALGPEDVGKLRIGSLSPFTIQFLRDIKSFLAVSFKIQTDPQSRTVLLTGVGTGFTNVSKKVT